MKHQQPPRLLTISKFPTGETYRLEALDGQLEMSEQFLGEIVAHCSAGPIWEWLFKGLLDHPYGRDDAAWYVGKCRENWAAGVSAPYGIFDPAGCMVGACDIKEEQADGTAELGYWLGADHSGVMTNAVKKLVEVAEAAGYTGLYARVELENVRSRAVLERAGFEWVKKTIVKREDKATPMNLLSYWFGE